MKTRWTVKFNSLKTLALLAAGGLVTQLASGQCVAPPGGIVGWWPGDGNANDNAGNANGTLENGATANQLGLVGQTFCFDGIDDGVLVPHSPLWGFGGGELTVEAWIKLNRVKDSMIVVQESSGFEFYVGAGGTVLDFNGDEYHNFVYRPWIPLTNVWYHVAGVHYVGRSQLYVNGEPWGSANTNAVQVANVAAPLRIGRYKAASYNLDGCVDEPSVYNRALSAAEIKAIFDAGSQGKCKGLSIIQQPQSQLGYWGKSVSFSVTATSGVLPYNYQWQKDGLPISDATNSLLVLTNLQTTNAGIYTVVVSDAVTNLLSQPATLTVNPAGVSLALYAGVTIDGVVGQTYGVQSTLDLSNTNSWLGRTNITLTTPTYLWYDSQPATNPQTFYRVLPGPIPIP